MTIRRIAVTYGRTFNTGNYSSLKLECTIEADVDYGADDNPPAQALAVAWEIARAEVRAQYERFTGSQKAATS